MNEISVKIILLGDSSVGKSSLMLRFTDNIYEENKVSTIGVEFKNKYIKILIRKYLKSLFDFYFIYIKYFEVIRDRILYG